MTRAIQKAVTSLLQVSQRMIERELPKIASVIRKIDKWIASFSYKDIQKMPIEDRIVYQDEKIKELQREIDHAMED